MNPPLQVNPFLSLAISNFAKEVVDYKVMEECLSCAVKEGSITQEEVSEELTKRLAKIEDMKKGLRQLQGNTLILELLRW